jgi:ADP-ribose diphosphatase
MTEKPKILNTSTIAQSKLFSIEQVSLEFSNGEQRNYERIIASSSGAVLIIPLIDEQNFMMIKEYSVGSHRYELLFPKGRIDEGESIEQAANRELMEEIGFAANKLTHIHSMTIAPGYLGFETHIILAEDLYEKKIPGDEPETLEVVKFNLKEFDRLISNPELTESRSIAALYMTRDFINKKNNHE